MGEARRRAALRAAKAGDVKTFDVPRVTLAVAVILLPLIGVVTLARAHSFYPPECCSDRDCWPADGASAPGEPQPVETASGWLLHDGTWVARGEERPSPDGRYHVCRAGGVPDGVLIRIGRRACFFAPPPAM